MNPEKDHVQMPKGASRWAALLGKQGAPDVAPGAWLRARILGFALLLIAIPVVLLTAVNLYELVTGRTSTALWYVASDVVAGLLIWGMWHLNRRGHTRWAGLLFVFLMSMGTLTGFSMQTLEQMLPAFGLPIMLVSFIYSPLASFLAAIVVTVSYVASYLSHAAAGPFSYLGVASLFGIALLSWRTAWLLQGELRRRWQTEAALRQSEDKFRSFFDHSEDAIVLADERGIVTDWSRSAERLFGFRREEAIGQALGAMQQQLMPVNEPEQIERLKGLMGAAFGGGQLPMLNSLTDMAIRQRDGTRRYVQMMAFPMQTAAGFQLGSISRDVTAQKRAEEQVRINEARLLSLLSISQRRAGSEEELLSHALEEVVKLTSSKVGYVFLYDEQKQFFTVHSWSREAMGQCGITQPALRYELSETGLWGEAVRRREAVIVNDFAAPNPLKRGWPEGHVPLTRFLTVPVFAQERIVAVVGVGNKEGDYDDADVRECKVLMDSIWASVERVRAERALRDSERRYRTFVNATADLVYLKDSNYRHILANDAMCRYFGKPESEIIGRTDYELMPKEGADSCRATDRTAIKTGSLVAHEETVGDRTFETIKFPVELEQGEIGVGGYIRDVTERKRVEQQRHELEHRLQQAQRLESLGVLAGGIAHDFNNLLMAILGYAELAEREVPASSPARANLQEIAQATQRATDLTRQMLAYAGRGQAQLVDLDLTELVEDMVQLVQVSVSKWAQLKLDLQRDLPCIRADAAQVRQIVMNLIINASEAIGDTPGTIIVKTGAMDCDADYLYTSYVEDNLPAGRYVYIEVTDTGCGMDKDTQQRIFEPFFTTKFTGRGLGLAAVLGIVRGHKGLLKLYSEPGRGATFKVLFPAMSGSAPRAPHAAAEPEWQGSGTVLLVDDEVTVRGVARKMLEREGFAVLVATDGEMALDVYREHRDEIDLVLLDMTMPRMDGAETFRRLRKVDPAVRVILSSGYSDEVAGKIVDEGMAGFVQKPYTLASLRAVLRRTLTGHGDANA